LLGGFDFDGSETSPLFLTADIDERLLQPAVKAAFAAERRAGSQCDRERLLNRVAGAFSVAKHRVTEPEKGGIALPVDLLDRSLGRT
jgi:hypothetical protein